MASAATASPASVAWTNPWSTSTPTTSARRPHALLHRGGVARRDRRQSASRSARAACGLRQLERGLRVGARLDLRADDHHDLRRQEPLAQQAAAGLAARVSRRPAAHRCSTSTTAAYSPSPISSVRRRRSSSAKPAVRWNASCGVRPAVAAAVRARAGARSGSPARAAGRASSGLRSTSVSLPSSPRWTQPRVHHPEQPAPAQEADLARDVAAEALGRLEPDRAGAGAGRCWASSMLISVPPCQDGTDEPFADPRQPCRRR